MAVQDVASPEELDLTGYHLHDLSSVHIPDDLKVKESCIQRNILAMLPLCQVRLKSWLQVLDLMTNRLRELDDRILSLTGKLDVMQCFSLPGASIMIDMRFGLYDALSYPCRAPEAIFEAKPAH